MTAKKAKYYTEVAKGVYEQRHFETSIDQVVDDTTGESLDSKLKRVDKAVDNVASNTANEFSNRFKDVKLNSGVEVQRSGASNAKLVFDETDDRWKMDKGDGKLVGVASEEEVKELQEKSAEKVVIESDGLRVTSIGFVGDGTTDDTNILQQAINYAIVNKRKLILPDAICLIANGLTIDGELTVQGSVNTTLKLTPDASTNDVIHLSGDNIQLIDININGNALLVRGINCSNAQNLKMSNVTITNTGKVAVAVADCTNVDIDQLTISKSSTTNASENYIGALHIIYSNLVNVRNSHVHDANSKGVEILMSEDVVVENTVVHNTTADAGDGFYVGIQSKRTLLRNCSSLDSQGNGVKVSRGAEDTIVDNCTIRKNRGVGHGILIQGAIDITVKQSYITSAIGGGVSIEDHPPEGESDTLDVVLQSNKIVVLNNVGPTIQIRNRPDTNKIVRDILITNNHLIGGTFGVLSNEGDVKVNNNVIKSGNNVSVAFYNDTPRANVIVTNNLIFAATGKSAIELIRCKDSVVSGNRVNVNGGSFGIVCSTGCSVIDVAANHVKAAVTAAITAPDTTSVDIIFRDNIIDGALSDGQTSRGIDYRALRGKILNNTINNVTSKIFIAVQAEQQIINSGNEFVVPEP